MKEIFFANHIICIPRIYSRVFQERPIYSTTFFRRCHTPPVKMLFWALAKLIDDERMQRREEKTAVELFVKGYGRENMDWETDTIIVFKKNETEMVIDLLNELKLPQKIYEDCKNKKKISDYIIDDYQTPYTEEETIGLLDNMEHKKELLSAKQLLSKMDLIKGYLLNTRKRKEREFQDRVIKEAMHRLDKKRKYV